MKLSSRVELYGGLTAALLGAFTATFNLVLVWDLSESNNGPKLYLSLILGFILFFVPNVLIGVGTYAHAVREKSWGTWVLGFGTLWIDIVILAFFVGIVWSNPLGWSSCSLCNSRWQLRAFVPLYSNARLSCRQHSS